MRKWERADEPGFSSERAQLKWSRISERGHGTPNKWVKRKPARPSCGGVKFLCWARRRSRNSTAVPVRVEPAGRRETGYVAFVGRWVKVGARWAMGPTERLRPDVACKQYICINRRRHTSVGNDGVAAWRGEVRRTGGGWPPS